MHVRRATLSDAAAMSALASHAFIDAYGGSSPPDDLEHHIRAYFSLEAITGELEQPGVQYFVADDAGVLAGLVKLREAGVPDAVPAESAIEVQQLYVDTAAQRGGVGQKLMQRAVDATRDSGAGGIWLSVWTEADWATSFYRKHGFVPVGEAEFCLGKTRYVDYLMWLAVHPAAGT